MNINQRKSSLPLGKPCCQPTVCWIVENTGPWGCQGWKMHHEVESPTSHTAQLPDPLCLLLFHTTQSHAVPCPTVWTSLSHWQLQCHWQFLAFLLQETGKWLLQSCVYPVNSLSLTAMLSSTLQCSLQAAFWTVLPPLPGKLISSEGWMIGTITWTFQWWLHYFQFQSQHI